MRRAWERLLSGPGAIETPDPFVNDYVRAVAGQMAQQVACRTSSDVWMYKTSPNHYEGYWPCNAAKALPTFDFRGLGDINRRVLGSFVDQQTADTGRLSRAGMGGGPELTGEGYEQRPGFLGNFGFFEAIDYTPSRLPRGQSRVIIRSYMGHHVGMSFLSLAYLLLDRPMQKRFEADPLFHASTLVSQERIPKATPFYAHSRP